jgi:hypothetical protein
VEEDGRPTLTGDPTDPSPQPVAWDQRVEPVPPAAGDHLAATIAALADPATRSPRPDTCPFLRTIDAAGAAAAPIEMPDPANRCVAVGEPTPQSTRQQQLVCLSTGHSNCPRYLHGALLAADALALEPARRSPSVPIVVSVLILVAAAAMSVGFLLVRGGFDLPAAASGAGASEVAVVPSPALSGAPVVSEPVPSPAGAVETSGPPVSPPPSAAPSVSAPSSAPPPTPSPAATLAPTPVAIPATGGTAARYALLVKCPGTPNCWIYNVRSGDNLRSIVNWFGVPYDTVLRMNPQIRDAKNIRAGDRIRMPPPTR